VEKGKSLPSQSTPAKPADMDAWQTEVAPHGIRSSQGTTPDVAVTNDPHCDYGRKINKFN
ncbi:hypothetical protein M9458_052158, partial [Cirrhinus mrigala]